MAGYSGTPLAAKLGFKAGFRSQILGTPAHFPDLLAPLPDGVEFIKNARAKDLDLVLCFVVSLGILSTRLRSIRPRIKPDGMIWIAWPKRASGVETDVTENVVRELALAAKLVDVKVCAIDETWSGLKLVFPVALRSKKTRS